MEAKKIHFAKVHRFNSPRLSYKEGSDGKYVKSGQDTYFLNI